MIVVKPPTDIDLALIKRVGAKTVFLAGSIEQGRAEDWQTELSSAFSDQDVVFFNPRRDAWDASWKQDPTPGTKFEEQVSWELAHVEAADIVVFYFDPETKSPVTLLELGLCLGSGARILVCCPKGYFRRGNVVITCKRHGIKVLEDLNALQSALEKLL